MVFWEINQPDRATSSSSPSQVYAQNPTMSHAIDHARPSCNGQRSLELSTCRTLFLSRGRTLVGRIMWYTMTVLIDERVVDSLYHTAFSLSDPT